MLRRPLISTHALAHRLGSVKVLDASWHMPTSGRVGSTEFAKKRIPGARFFDIDAISDKSSPYPHMLPSAQHFSSCVSSLGISNQDDVVVYDSVGMFSAARVYWMFRVFGHDNISLLDGGLPKWERDGYTVDSAVLKEPIEYASLSNLSLFTATKVRSELVRSLSDMRELTSSKTLPILDARSGDRFYARVPEPRPGLRAGHMPGAKNVPFGTVLNSDGTFKATDDLKKLFSEVGVNIEQKPQVVTSCGSGVTACVVLTALEVAGVPLDRMSVYDGSHSEWGAQSDTAVETA